MRPRAGKEEEDELDGVEEESEDEEEEKEEDGEEELEEEGGDCQVVLSVVKSRDQSRHDFVTEILKALVVISFIAFIFHSDPEGSNWRRLQACPLRGR
ncbi:hypothetical protein E2C01_067434 [Portunus trituberculatus]|uniref:Uncharacterized protein n=1 Tax=Portunus trituberculatus TaxID=210409 RepID=A0A5B7HTL2_PORTR|nr:hypothetical protein [Portunus trituberculatus]